jgi:hypothetical protein
MKEHFPLPPLEQNEHEENLKRSELVDAAALVDYDEESVKQIVKNFNKKDNIDNPLRHYIEANHESLDPKIQENVAIYKNILGIE